MIGSIIGWDGFVTPPGHDQFMNRVPVTIEGRVLSCALSCDGTDHFVMLVVIVCGADDHEVGTLHRIGTQRTLRFLRAA